LSICLTERFALGRVGPPAEVLLRDDVRRVLGPGLGELDPGLLEGDLAAMADAGIAQLPSTVENGSCPGSVKYRSIERPCPVALIRT